VLHVAQTPVEVQRARLGAMIPFGQRRAHR
jgi:hypothetical protein